MRSGSAPRSDLSGHGGGRDARSYALARSGATLVGPVGALASIATPSVASVLYKSTSNESMEVIVCKQSINNHNPI